ncbi:hypothetical protein WJX73_007558 [Symbiochloris irregularis]|uniref:Exostosin GT47 domain-containing protein n=1 Tax=Symbiochloris irregularis TaxID=706552 RepID=A0AAW1PYW2_9CHLO
MTRWPNKTSCEEADVVYVPFLTCQVGEDDAANKAWLELDRDTEKLLPFVKTKPHLIVLARTEWISRQFDKKSMGHLLDRDHKYNFTYTTIEVFNQVWKDRTGPRNVISVPHPTFLHFHEGMAPEAFDAGVLTARKTRLAIETFYARFDFRKRLKAACEKVPHLCLDLPFDYWHQNNPKVVKQWMDETANSWFCLNPTGDMPTRKSTVDCLMAGTIPVVFDYWVPHTFFFGDVINATDVLIYIDQSKLEKDPMALFEYLGNIPVADRLRMLQNIYKWRQVFNYSLTPKGGDIRFDNLRELQPGDDGFTFVLKAVVRNMCDRKLIGGNKCP